MSINIWIQSPLSLWHIYNIEVRASNRMQMAQAVERTDWYIALLSWLLLHSAHPSFSCCSFRPLEVSIYLPHFLLQVFQISLIESIFPMSFYLQDLSKLINKSMTLYLRAFTDSYICHLRKHVCILIRIMWGKNILNQMRNCGLVFQATGWM